MLGQHTAYHTGKQKEGKECENTVGRKISRSAEQENNQQIKGKKHNSKQKSKEKSFGRDVFGEVKTAEERG